MIYCSVITSEFAYTYHRSCICLCFFVFRSSRGRARKRSIALSKTPDLFNKNVRLPIVDPIQPTPEVLEELKESASSDEVYDQLIRFYPKIRTRVIESTRTFTFSNYRLRLPPDNESRNRSIKDFLEKVIDRQSVGASFNIGTGAILAEREPNGTITYRHWHGNPSNSAYYPTAKFISTKAFARKLIEDIDMTTLLTNTHYHAATTSSTNLEMVSV